MNKWFRMDERTESVSGRLAVIVLGLLQIGMYLAIMIQRYVLERPPAHYNDLALLLALSVLAYFGASLYLGGILPALSIRAAMLIYVFAVLAIAIPHTIVRGWPAGSDWGRRALVYLGIPGVLVGGYGLMAYMGKKRLEKMLGSDTAG